MIVVLLLTFLAFAWAITQQLGLLLAFLAGQFAALLVIAWGTASSPTYEYEAWCERRGLDPLDPLNLATWRNRAA